MVTQRRAALIPHAGVPQIGSLDNLSLGTHIHHMPRRIAVLAALAVLAVPLFAQSVKEPWSLTLEERIALRTDPELARERVRKTRGMQTKSASAAKPAVDQFDGKSHPELFLPHQVFRSLMNLTFLAPEASAYRNRQGLMPEVKSHRLPPDFWERLRAVSVVYISDSLTLDDLARRCRLRAVLRERARSSRSSGRISTNATAALRHSRPRGANSDRSGSIAFCTRSWPYTCSMSPTSFRARRTSA